MRKVIYVSGTRADFGLMASTLKLAARDPELDVSVCVTGMHLDRAYGDTVKEVESSGIRISARIPVSIGETTGASMARAVGRELLGMVDLFEREAPDIVMLLGDRGEMLAGAIAALHLNIHVAHIHGGELSGTIDEPVRHAISKLSHFHFTSTEGSRERLIRMGEEPGNIYVTGAPGLDGQKELVTLNREELCKGAGMDSERPVAILVLHPVVQEADLAGVQLRAVMDALLKNSVQVMALRPNADAGGQEISAALDSYSGKNGVTLRTHIGRPEFVSWLAASDIMIGNSSSGIIEAATFGTPVINTGSRQNRRERNLNVVDTALDKDAIASAIKSVLSRGRFKEENIYGDGHSGERIVELLKTVSIDGSVLEKCNAY